MAKPCVEILILCLGVNPEFDCDILNYEVILYFYVICNIDVKY